MAEPMFFHGDHVVLPRKPEEAEHLSPWSTKTIVVGGGGGGGGGLVKVGGVSTVYAAIWNEQGVLIGAPTRELLVKRWAEITGKIMTPEPVLEITIDMS